MKQLVQNIKKKLLEIEEFPVPYCKHFGVLVKTYFSAVSVGTELMKLKNSDLSYLQMARKKPDQMKEVINTLTQQGPVATFRKVMNKLDSLTPLGYSLVGEVIEVGEDINEFKIGDIVACGGAGYANHAEVNFIPKNLCVKVPGNVNLKQAAFTTIASIAMQGFRQARPQIGENIAVIGLGLLGQILVQIIQANGCRAFGFDISPKKCEMALQNGAYYTEVNIGTDYEERIKSVTNGIGADAVIITTGTTSNDPILLAGKIARDRGRIVDIGITKMDLPWDLYYHKELDFRFSRSYGPGRYDPTYEEGGNDYPVGYVRWTEKRNMVSVLQLMSERKIDLTKLITHEYSFYEAGSVFQELKKIPGNYLGIVLEYNRDIAPDIRKIDISNRPIPENKDIRLGMIGAGNYASTMLLPFLKGKVGLMGIATATGINAKDKARKYGFSYATTNYKDILNDKTLNTIIIATRHNQHAKMVIEALNQGKNVYVEKPLAITIEEIRSVHKSLMKTRGILMIGYNRRYAPSIKYLKKHLKRDYPYSIYYQVNAGYIPPNNWYQSPEQGGRIIGEVCHFIDTLQYLLDADPVEVYANNSAVNGIPDQDNTFITIKFDNGSSCVIAYVADGNEKYSKEKILITGYKSNWEFDNFKKITGFSDKRNVKKIYPLINKGQREEMSVLIHAVKTGKFPVPYESLLKNTLTTILAVRSIHTGEPYKLNLSDFL